MLIFSPSERHRTRTREGEGAERRNPAAEEPRSTIT
jgi:hypothetical protein